MMITPADWERAEQYLEPLSYETETGVTITAHQVRDPDPASRLWVAYKTYLPPLDQPSAGDSLGVLFIHDAHQSGQLYHEAALGLAEQGIRAAALSLGLHGSGRWYSHDGWRPVDLTIERYARQVRLVVQALPGNSGTLVLAGGGVLGSLLAQQTAHDLPLAGMPLAGIALLGGCLPHLAAATGGDRPTPRWGHRRQTHPQQPLVPPPDQASIRARWLGHEVPDQEVFAVWQLLCAESPRVRQGYAALAGQRMPVPAVPALVLAGEQDTLVPRTLLEQTAAAYGVQPVIIPGAPHLLVRSKQQYLVLEHLAAFCQNMGFAVSGQRAAR